MGELGDKYYNYALDKIDDLGWFIELTNELDKLSKEGRINDMRRLLVVRWVEKQEEKV